MTNTQLRISENFFSIQGEGATCGNPAVFLRLTGCALRCQYCDTLEVWQKGDYFLYEDLWELFVQKGYAENLRSGAHLVITGGDPMLQQMQVKQFLDLVHQRIPPIHCIEVETEGVILPYESFAGYVHQWNVSPKLSNSGVPLEKRYKPLVLSWHNRYGAIFKFPVLNEMDVLEVDQIVAEVGIKANDVYLMPICATRQELSERSQIVAELALKRNYCFSPRLQLLIWDQTCGK